MGKSICHRLKYSSILCRYIYFSKPEPIDVETVIELAHALQTTALQRLTIDEFEDKAFKVLVQYLPQTLVYLDLQRSLPREDSIPILRSYLESNVRTLKTLSTHGNRIYYESLCWQQIREAS